MAVKMERYSQQINNTIKYRNIPTVGGGDGKRLGGCEGGSWTKDEEKNPLKGTFRTKQNKTVELLMVERLWLQLRN